MTLVFASQTVTDGEHPEDGIGLVEDVKEPVEDGVPAEHEDHNGTLTTIRG